MILQSGAVVTVCVYQSSRELDHESYQETPSSDLVRVLPTLNSTWSTRGRSHIGPPGPSIQVRSDGAAIKMDNLQAKKKSEKNEPRF